MNSTVCGIVYALDEKKKIVHHITQIPKQSSPAESSKWKEQKEPIGYPNSSVCSEKNPIWLSSIYVVWSCSSYRKGKGAVCSVCTCLYACSL